MNEGRWRQEETQNTMKKDTAEGDAEKEEEQVGKNRE